MVYCEDSTEKGKHCQVILKSQVIDCVVICSHEYKKKDGSIRVTYTLQDKNKNIFTDISKNDITFKK